MKRLLVGALAMCLASCGSSTTPSGSSNIAGTWSGVMTFTVPPVPGITFTLTAILVQSGGTVTGTWSLTGAGTTVESGAVSGTVTGTTFAGVLTNTAPCTSVIAPFSTTTGSTSMTWTSASGFTGAGGIACENMDTSAFTANMKEQ